MTKSDSELNKILDEYFSDRTNASTSGGTGTRGTAHRKATRRIENLIARHDATLREKLLAALPIRQGGAATGRNYWTGVAKGNNDTLDEIETAINQVFGGEDE